MGYVMLAYVINCSIISLLVGAILVSLGNARRKKILAHSKLLFIAEYSATHRLIAVISGAVLFCMPLLLSNVLKEENPVSDRIVMAGYYLLILYFNLAIFNRKVMLTECTILASGMLGKIQVIPNEKFKRAHVARIKMSTRGYKFSNEYGRIVIDEKMAGFHAVEMELRQRAAM
jgi:hypothetical protein